MSAGIRFLLFRRGEAEFEIGAFERVGVVHQVRAAEPLDEPLPHGVQTVFASHAENGEGVQVRRALERASFAPQGWSRRYTASLLEESTTGTWTRLAALRAADGRALLAETIPQPELVRAIATCAGTPIDWWIWNHGGSASGLAGVVFPESDESDLVSLAWIGLRDALRGRGLGVRIHADALALLRRCGGRRYVDSVRIDHPSMHRIMTRNGCRADGLYGNWVLTA